jgi:hypothetical protein
MSHVTYKLDLDNRGVARLSVDAPYELLGHFLASIISHGRIMRMREAIANYGSSEHQHLYYAHDYHELDFDPDRGMVQAYIDYPDGTQSCGRSRFAGDLAASEFESFSRRCRPLLQLVTLSVLRTAGDKRVDLCRKQHDFGLVSDLGAHSLIY